MTDDRQRRSRRLGALTRLGMPWRGRYYDRAGNPVISMAAFVRIFNESSDQERRVARDVIGRVEVSTVWLGIDHSFGALGPPLIFETMVFGGTDDGMQTRYATEEEALVGHAEAVERIRSESG